MNTKRELIGETLGTFLLVLMIFALTEGCNVGRPDSGMAPVFIGLTVSSLLCLLAPLTQAGLNPARDLGPRLVAWMAGWGAAAFPDRVGGFLHVYVFAPLLGGALAAFFFVRMLEPARRDSTERPDCVCAPPWLTGESPVPAPAVGHPSGRECAVQSEPRR